MGKAELIEKLGKLNKEQDVESAHGVADDLLIDYINDPEIKAAYDAVDKWYA